MSYGIPGALAVGAAAGVIYSCITRRVNNSVYYALGTMFVSYAANIRFGQTGFHAVSAITLITSAYTAISERMAVDRLNRQTNRLREQTVRVEHSTDEINRSTQRIALQQAQIALGNIEVANRRMGNAALRQISTLPPNA